MMPHLRKTVSSGLQTNKLTYKINLLHTACFCNVLVGTIAICVTNKNMPELSMEEESKVLDRTKIRSCNPISYNKLISHNILDLLTEHKVSKSIAAPSSYKNMMFFTTLLALSFFIPRFKTSFDNTLYVRTLLVI